MRFAMPFLLMISMTSVYAQDEPPTWAPLELFGCNFVEGADMDDLDAVIDNWNDWMDENGLDNYTGVVLSPHFTAGPFPYDVLWVGVWEDSAALGGTQQWLAEGGEIQDDFAEVVQCPLHQAFASNNVQPPAEATGIVPVAFSNCTINEGRIGPEARAAIVEYTEYLAEHGSVNGHWILRPAAGEQADADYSFKWVRSYSSWSEVGEYFDLLYNGGGIQRLGQITGRVMSCDSPRLYNSRLVRENAEE
jgi:hypothetical protein